MESVKTVCVIIFIISSHDHLTHLTYQISGDNCLTLAWVALNNWLSCRDNITIWVFHIVWAKQNEGTAENIMKYSNLWCTKKLDNFNLDLKDCSHFLRHGNTDRFIFTLWLALVPRLHFPLIKWFSSLISWYDHTIIPQFCFERFWINKEIER